MPSAARRRWLWRIGAASFTSSQLLGLLFFTTLFHPVFFSMSSHKTNYQLVVAMPLLSVGLVAIGVTTVSRSEAALSERGVAQYLRANRLHERSYTVERYEEISSPAHYLVRPVDVIDSPDSGPARWISLVSAGLDPRAIEALSRIPDVARRLLALRGYLRAGDTLSARWSWSQREIAAYPASEEGRAAGRDIDAVAAAFARANPGYTLEANRQPRSLEQQLANWNSNASVARTAHALVEFMSGKFSGNASVPPGPELRAALLSWSPPGAATLAVPGLSAHGQGRAYDFRVLKNGAIVAGTEAATARERWDKAGWTAKLRAAVVTAGTRFTGPLQSPYEPWHYAYLPAS